MTSARQPSVSRPRRRELLRAEVFLVTSTHRPAAAWRIFAANGRVLAVSGRRFRRASSCRDDLEQLRLAPLATTDLQVVRVAPAGGAAGAPPPTLLAWRWVLTDDELTPRARSYNAYSRQVQAQKSGRLFLELLQSFEIDFGATEVGSATAREP